MKTLVFCLEEPSAKDMLDGVLPRLLPDSINVRYIVFEGKQDMDKNLVRRLKHWQLPDTAFIVMRDQDSANCRDIKRDLKALCEEAGRPQTLIRIACHELESFYLGDLRAVAQGLSIHGLERQQQSRKYRTPDALGNPAQELKKLTSGKYQKRLGSRSISPLLRLDGENRSTSFRALIQGIQKLLPDSPDA